MNTALTSSALLPATPPPWLVRVGGALWRTLEETGRARAQHHLLDFADQCQALQPELAKELRTAARHNPLA